MMLHSPVKRLGFGASVAIVTCGVTCFAVRARAAGIPDAAALTYTGYLENPDGTPVTGKKSIGLSVYDAETKAKQFAASILPTSSPSQVAFSCVADECTDAVKGNPDLWIEIMVEGALLGRTKLGAVPYAVVAGHAADAPVMTEWAA